jgi:hypothetical protein
MSRSKLDILNPVQVIMHGNEKNLKGFDDGATLRFTGFEEFAHRPEFRIIRKHIWKTWSVSVFT